VHGAALSYPEARRGEDADVLHGIVVADAYRWLEDAGAPETQAWSAAQDRLCHQWLGGLPGRHHLARRIRELLPGFVGLPKPREQGVFFERREVDQDHPVLGVQLPDGTARVLIDPSALSPEHTVTLDAWEPSLDGRRLAYLLSDRGTEEAVLAVMEVDTQATVDGPFVVGRSGLTETVAWLPGGEEYFYVGRLPDERLPRGEEQFHRRVWRRRIGAGATLVFGEPPASRAFDKIAYYGLAASVDGRWLRVSVSLGTAPRNDVYLADMADPDAGWITVQEGLDARTEALVAADGLLYLLTDLDAPRGRLAVTDPRRPAPEHWRDLVPEGDDVITGWALTDDDVFVLRRHHVVAVLDVHDRATGSHRAQVELPGQGTALLASRPGGVGSEVWISYTDHTAPPLVLRCDEERQARPWASAASAAAPSPDPSPQVQQVFVTSGDGTRLPMFVITPAGAEPDAAHPRPTVVYGYGGFNVAMEPAYSAGVIAWVEAGGVYAFTCLRGGSEYGEQWHRAGMRANKQNVFDDFAACARWLVAAGWTDQAHLGVNGGSNGGLLVGAALTQHAEMFAAAVCSAPLLDMVRYERFGLGTTWNDEYGRAEDPEELDWLLGYSPYHHVAAGTCYPAVLFTVFDDDTRVDPLHARKMCAALQWATAAAPAERPVLIRREQDVGHSTRSVGRMIALAADTTSFLAERLGLTLPPDQDAT